MCCLSCTNSRAAVRAVRRLGLQTTCRRLPQLASPGGRPRRTRRRTASNFCSLGGSFTDATRFGSRAIGEGERSFGAGSMFCTQSQSDPTCRVQTLELPDHQHAQVTPAGMAATHPLYRTAGTAPPPTGRSPPRRRLRSMGGRTGDPTHARSHSSRSTTRPAAVTCVVPMPSAVLCDPFTAPATDTDTACVWTTTPHPSGRRSTEV